MTVRAARRSGAPWLYGRGPAGAAPAAGDGGGPLAAVLFDRDGTLVADVPYNGDPDRVVPMPGARAALDAVRARGLAVGVVTNQSGVARGLLTRAQVEAVHRRVAALLGPFDVWAVCPHGPADGCGCRKPAPGLVLAACHRLGVPPGRAAVVGDIGSDLAAARAAGARGVLVPTPVTRAAEIAAAPHRAADLPEAVRQLLGRRPAEGVTG
ncbi:HAD family hydrolase [Streptomyces sp. RS10V-4]|uniref:D-glycero-alpha-D-manno-heptose-1,7-bisphosphate 7-phosphatase n=1 Tax=Streptomyces rhizoryzae TaxID=2932493 RepID=UPI0020067A59|nr:HAD family hydrolase [Streptomyces rhizoryzae]MCK7624374.1 HAD family hydrolase [Streptomyces rhizoryzae]